MKILLLVPQLPYPPRKGAAIRTYYFVRWLARHHDVSLLAFSSEPGVPAHLRDICAGVRTVPPPGRTLGTRLRDLVRSSLPDLALRLRSDAYEEALLAWLREERFDVVQVESLEMSLPWLRIRSRLPRGVERPLGVFDDLNAEYLLQWRAFTTDLAMPGRWPAAAYSLVQTWKLKRYERRLCAEFGRIIAVSEDDAAVLRSLRQGLSPFVVPNGVDCAYFAFNPPTAPRPSQIVFTGTMDFRPNVDAVCWFARAVFPRIRQQAPGATFVVVGANPAPAVRRLAADPGVVVTGAVDDVRPYLAQSSVYVVPMRIGGGIRLKALEAMASGLPVVSTSLGCSGTIAEPGRHYVQAEGAADFAHAVLALLRGERDSQSMVAAARRLVEAHYDWDRLCPALEGVYAGRQHEDAWAPGR